MKRINPFLALGDLLLNSQCKVSAPTAQNANDLPLEQPDGKHGGKCCSKLKSKNQQRPLRFLWKPFEGEEDYDRHLPRHE